MVLSCQMMARQGMQKAHPVRKCQIQISTARPASADSNHNNNHHSPPTLEKEKKKKKEKTRNKKPPWRARVALPLGAAPALIRMIALRNVSCGNCVPKNTPRRRAPTSVGGRKEQVYLSIYSFIICKLSSDTELLAS